MTSLTITLPEDLAAQAKAKGLLSAAAIVTLLREKVGTNELGRPPEFDPRLEGAVDPAMLGRGRIVGDIVGPFHDEWGDKP